MNEREMTFLEKNMPRGCFRPRAEKNRHIIYTAPNVTELAGYLKTPVSAELFFKIVAQTVEMAKRIELGGLYLPNLVLDTKLVFLNEQSKEVFFIYQPIVSRYTYGNLYRFLESLCQAARGLEEDGDDIKGFAEFLADISFYRISDVEAYVREVCPQAYRKIVLADAGKSGFITNSKLEYRQHYEGTDGTTVLFEDEGSKTEPLCEGDTVKLAEELPKLVRCKTGEKREIDREVFLIGKESSCEFSVADNKAVSRRHARIEKESEACYLVDLESTNHTYLDGRMLESNVPYALSDGALIRIADEEFQFEWRTTER